METPDRDGQGGQRRQFHQIVALQRMGHDITVFVPRSAQSDRSIREFARTLRPRFNVLGRPSKYLGRRADRLISGSHWDAIIVSHHESWWLLPKYGPALPPTLLDVHNVLSFWHSSGAREELAATALQAEAWAVKEATAVTTCSDTECERLVHMHPTAAAKIFTAPLGIDPVEWPDQTFDRTKPIVALFGSWGWEPNALGLAWFLGEVWPRVRAELPDAVALVAGSGVHDAHVWPDGARFVGRVSDLAGFTASASVVAVPVIDGVGASVKFAEALATGAAVVATPDGANAFSTLLAFVSADPVEWADWIIQRLRRRAEEPAPSTAREPALRDLTWEAAVRPIDEWLGSIDVQPPRLTVGSS